MNRFRPLMDQANSRRVDAEFATTISSFKRVDAVIGRPKLTVVPDTTRHVRVHDFSS